MQLSGYGVEAHMAGLAWEIGATDTRHASCTGRHGLLGVGNMHQYRSVCALAIATDDCIHLCTVSAFVGLDRQSMIAPMRA